MNSDKLFNATINYLKIRDTVRDCNVCTHAVLFIVRPNARLGRYDYERPLRYAGHA